MQNSPTTVAVFVPVKVADCIFWVTTDISIFMKGEDLEVEECWEKRLEEWIELWSAGIVWDRLEEELFLETRGLFDDVFPEMADALSKENIARRELEEHGFQELGGWENPFQRTGGHSDLVYNALASYS
jgi:hypothetical protein